jgi:Holliday junction resolvasome RuvABC endonuclease subunit
MFDSTNQACIMGIDPGSDTLGLARIAFDIPTMTITSISARTFVGSRMFDDKGWVAGLVGDRRARIEWHRQNLINHFLHFQPVQIACESPFFNRLRPNAFQALLEVTTMIQEAVAKYDPWRKLYQIDPPTVKKSVGAPGNADKNVVKKFVIQNLSQFYNGEVPLEMLDEHSIDAIAVTYCRWCGLLRSEF